MTVKYRNVIKAFTQCGFAVIREAKHTIMQSSRTHRTIAIPRHNEVNLMIIRRLAKENGIDVTNLLELLK